MEPMIPDTSYCVFRIIPAGSRQGKIVLAQHHSIDDVETGGSYTVKRYESRKQESDGEVAGTVELQPLNPEFKTILLEPGDEDQVEVIAEFVAVLRKTAE
jgi:SOS-response transcriptional repressor LexA